MTNVSFPARQSGCWFEFSVNGSVDCTCLRNVSELEGTDTVCAYGKILGGKYTRRKKIVGEIV